MMLKARTLLDLEEQYGGGSIERVGRRVVSEHDPRIKQSAGAVEKIPGSMVSGARFRTYPYYARTYADLLRGMEEQEFTLVELGVLRGVGLAIWADVFPNAHVIGLDIDPGLFQADLLRERGAFRKQSPDVRQFDELDGSARGRLKDILGSRRITVMIDDALHDDDSILRSLTVFMPLMAERFFYFIEDNETVGEKVSAFYPAYRVLRRERLTVVTRQ